MAIVDVAVPKERMRILSSFHLLLYQTISLLRAYPPFRVYDRHTIFSPHNRPCSIPLSLDLGMSPNHIFWDSFD
ncbi:hypothetical protein F4801DRAFT_571920 [Xylaria longipes]|nr:hypothetical protein F4801DRAFT_571920 [Xylaria longipes]